MRPDLDSVLLAERESCKRHFDAVMRMLASEDKSAAVGDSDEYLARVLVRDGRRVYGTVLSMIEAACGIPSKDVPRY